MNVLVGALVFIVSSGISYADLGILGDTVSVSRRIPSTGFSFGPFVYTVQAGPADIIALSTGDNHYLNIEDTSLQFYFGPSHGSGGPYTPSQHFVLFEDLSPTAPPIVGLTYETDLQGSFASDLSFTAHTVTIGNGGLNWSGGQYLTVNLELIPEPSIFALLGIGVAVVAVRQTRILWRHTKVNGRQV
jgi:hypothetical protein